MKRITISLLAFLVLFTSTFFPYKETGTVSASPITVENVEPSTPSKIAETLESSAPTVARDTTPPELVSLDVTPKKATVGETVYFKAKATDDLSGIRSFSLLYNYFASNNAYAETIRLELIYNSKNDLWEAEHTFNKYTGNGTVEFQHMMMYDQSFNVTSLLRYQLDDNGKYDFMVINPTGGDIEDPILQNIDISTNEINAPGTVQLTISAKDNKSGVDSIEIYYSSPNLKNDNNKYAKALYNSHTGKWHAQLNFSAYDQKGLWTIDRIYIKDAIGNSTTHNRLMLTESYKLDINVINENEDTVPPTLLDIKISQNSIDAGGTINFEATASDNLSGIKHIDLNYFITINEYPISHNVRLYYDYAHKKYTSRLSVSDSHYKGYWILNGVIVYDNVQNSTAISRQKLNKGKALDIRVAVPENSDVTPPNKPIVDDVYYHDNLVSGTAEPNSIISIELENGLWTAHPVGEEGTFQVYLKSPSPAGAVLKAFVTDRYGNSSEATTIVVKGGHAQFPAKVFQIYEYIKFGELEVTFTSGLTPFDMKKEITITSENSKEAVDFTVVSSDFIFGKIVLQIKNPIVGQQYNVSFSDKFKLPETLDRTVSWSLSENNTEVVYTTFPLKPSINNDFMAALIMPYTGFETSKLSAKAYKAGTDQLMDETFVLKEIKMGNTKKQFTFTFSSSSVELVDIYFYYDALLLGKKNNVLIATKNDSTNNNPIWWLDSGIIDLHTLSSSSVLINWGTAHDVTGITQYRIIANGEVIDTVPADFHSYKITNLSLDTLYSISVEAGNAQGLWTTNGGTYDYKTPGPDKVVTGMEQYSNVLGGFYLDLAGVSDEEIKQGLKVYYLDQGIKKYVDFTIMVGMSSYHPYLVLTAAKMNTDFFVETVAPLQTKEGINTTLRWTSTLNKSKVLQHTTPSTPSVNKDFTFKVILDNEHGSGYGNVTRDNFKLLPLKAGTNELASGNLVIKDIQVGEDLNGDGSFDTKEESIHFITATYSAPEKIDIQVAVDDVILPEKLTNLNFISSGGTGGTRPPGGGGGGGMPSSSELVETSEGLQIKGDMKQVDWKNVISTLTKSKKNQIELELAGTISIPLDAILKGKADLPSGYMQFKSTAGIAKFNLKQIDENWIAEQFGDKDKSLQLVVETQQSSPTDTNSKIVATSLPVKMYVQSGDKKVEVDWLSSQVLLPTNYSGDVILVKKNARTNEWVYVPSRTIQQGTSQIVEATNLTSDVLYLINQQISFSDMKGHWADKDISWLASRYIVKGNSKGSFNPQNDISRAEFTSLLIRILGIEEDTKQSTSTFKDVDTKAWYFDDINTALKLGLVSGVDKDQYAPNKSITREEMAVMISKALKYLGKDVPAKETDSQGQFKDANLISSWAKDAVKLMVDTGLMQGKGDQQFDPTNYATRAESAVLIKKLLQLQ
ncbi:S-layer homology domain-containing protein [Paenibacillus sp. GSMTC-2017]|uniref:S-layer homology domain-containing protein n=1 Tax=Paenibacillus sp. GSMTC-2017 TaxID=2794350 RepID=UPI0018D63E8F|nr:S-layer homology domain-containing protein [Paenibacillus sp. GSMTC-2017]MBH5319718.1 S-layer homology domain-containing protein [Paenibacillus sp. GSMTC-2017]